MTQTYVRLAKASEFARFRDSSFAVTWLPGPRQPELPTTVVVSAAGLPSEDNPVLWAGVLSHEALHLTLYGLGATERLQQLFDKACLRNRARTGPARRVTIGRDGFSGWDGAFA